MDQSDVVEIVQLLNLYGHAADRVDRAMLAQVFTEDAVFDCTPNSSGKYEGLETIVAWFELGKPPHPPFHLVSNPYVYEQDGEVRALSKWTIANPATGTMMNGDYEDLLVRTEAGWRISERVATGRFLDTAFTAGVTFEDERE